MQDKLYVTKSRLPDKENFFRRLEEIFQTAWITNHGCHVRNLEMSLCDYLDVDELLLCNNGTTALMLALQCAGLAGKKIALTPYSYVATLSAILWMGCTPVFVDVDPETMCLSPEKLRKCLQDSPNIAGVLPVHVYGLACDVESLGSICRENGLTLIYDAAQAFGSRYAGKSLLDYGDYSICSFHATKLFHTAEGGCVVSHSTAAHQALSRARAFGHEGDTHYCLGINAKMSELHAVMGLSLLPGTEEEIALRKRVHAVYDSLLSGAGLSFPPLCAKLDWNYAYYPVLLPDEDSLLRVQGALAAQDIYTRRYFYPALNTLPYLKAEWQVSCPVAENLASRALCLPLYGDLEEKQIVRIAASLGKALADPPQGKG